MITKIFHYLFILMVALLLTSCVNYLNYVGALKVFFAVKRPLPLVKKIQLDHSGLLVDEKFTIRNYCGYKLNLRLLHKNSRLDEYKNKYKDRRLPVLLEINIFKNEELRQNKIYQNIVTPQRSGLGQNVTSFNIGGILLDEGEYVVHLESFFDESSLKDIDVNFVIQKTPKTICGKKVKKITDASVIKQKNKRLKFIHDIYTTRPDLIRSKYYDSILQGIIILGMTPFEAKLAGGAFTYQVKSDKSVWPKNCNPLQVIWMQSIKTDNSFIKMVFQNKSQLPQKGLVPFEVIFKKGNAVEIKEELK
jgi:hypothetical protein